MREHELHNFTVWSDYEYDTYDKRILKNIYSGIASNLRYTLSSSRDK